MPPRETLVLSPQTRWALPAHSRKAAAAGPTGLSETLCSFRTAGPVLAGSRSTARRLPGQALRTHTSTVRTTTAPPGPPGAPEAPSPVLLDLRPTPRKHSERVAEAARGSRAARAGLQRTCAGFLPAACRPPWSLQTRELSITAAAARVRERGGGHSCGN